MFPIMKLFRRLSRHIDCLLYAPFNLSWAINEKEMLSSERSDLTYSPSKSVSLEIGQVVRQTSQKQGQRLHSHHGHRRPVLPLTGRTESHIDKKCSLGLLLCRISPRLLMRRSRAGPHVSFVEGSGICSYYIREAIAGGYNLLTTSKLDYPPRKEP